MNTYDCPVCLKSHMILARYPSAVCNNCLKQYPLVNSTGQKIQFGNLSISGGFYCKNLVTGLMYYDEHVCFVNNIKCIADETQSGEFIINAIENNCK